MATVYLKQSSNTDTYGGFSAIPSFGGEWDGSDVDGRNPDWLTGMRASYNGKIYEALTNHDGDVNSPPNTNTTDWREVSGTLDDPYKATDLIQSNFLLDSLTDGDEVILTDGLYDYLPFSSTVYPQNGRPTLRALNDYEAIIGQSSFKPANILCVGLDVRNPAVNGYTNYPDGGRVGFNYHRCILSSGYWWPPANSVVTNCLIKQTNVLFYAAFGQATNSASTDKAIQMLNNTVILTSNSGQPLFSTLINQGLMNPVFKNNIFYIKSHAGSTSLAWNNGFYQGTWENNVFFDASGQVVNNTGNLINIEPTFVDPLGSSFRDFQLRPSSSLIGGITTTHPLNEEYPDGLWVDSAHTEINASYSFSLDTGDGSNYTFSGDATGTDPSINANIRDTLVFTNTTGGHALAIYNSQGIQVASEASGTTTFSPKYPDTYYYQCTVPGHENMRGNITVSMDTLGTESNPFSNYQSAIDARAYTGSCDILFKAGDHPMNSGQGPNGMAFESSYPNGIRFIGSSAKSTRLVSLDNINPWPMLNNNPDNTDTNATISGSDFYFINIGIHINNTTSYVNRGILGGFRNLTLRGCIFSATSTANISGGLIHVPSEWFDAKGCIFNLPLGKYPGGDMQWIGGSYGVTRYRIESCAFFNLSGYRRPPYENNTFFGGTMDANSYFKNSIVYTDIAALNQVVANGSGTQTGIWTTNWTGNIYYNSAADFINTPNVNSGSCIVADPLFVDLTTENEDFRLRANSPGIGGIKKEETGVYYLQPGNFFNGDGSQKDASSMSADGDPGPFNNFKEIIAAEIPYGSKIVILDGTYDWPNEFHQYSVSASNWQDYSFAGYNYHAETPGGVRFNANRQQKWFHYHALGGASDAGTYLDLDTEFHGVIFSDVVGTGSLSRNMVTSISDTAGKGSCSFRNCQFIDYFLTGASNYPFSGGKRGAKSSKMNWYGCVISICFDNPGGLFNGGDGFAANSDHGIWEFKNNTIVVQGIGQPTFNGRNAGGTSGVYQPASFLFGGSYDVSQNLVQGNVIYNPGGNAGLHSNSNYLPQYKNNLFLGINTGSHADTLDLNKNLLNIDPKFVDPANFKFNLRPNSPVIGKG